MNPSSRIPGALGVAASTLGGFFAAFSTHDYAEHLDRQLHGTHCSFLPGISDADTGENACSAAMYSPYSALFKDKLWGGLPISLFALGAFAFFFAMSLYLLLGTSRVSRATRAAHLVSTAVPALVSVVMLAISLTKLGQICKLCAGIYFSSALLLSSGITAWLSRGSGVSGGASSKPAKTVSDSERTQADPEPWHQKEDKADAKTRPASVATPPSGSALVAVGLLALLGVAAALPAVVYAGTLPDYTGRIVGCGKLSAPATAEGKKDPFVKVVTTSPVQPALSIEDPLCPTCRQFHQRLVADGVYDQLDMKTLVFPLDADCNWLLQGRSLHPGACVLAKAVLCAEGRGNARAVLDWSYDNQDELTEAGKRDKSELAAKVKQRFPELETCMAAKETDKRLDEVFHFAAENKIRVLTPQLYLGDQRVCDEDTDMGLRFAITKLAPKVK
ncbi:MAG TPA: vitamin K epoxide reductase family protein [Polyangiaceae bacterium]|jgi:uncharacterized membrane protein|nr:vitamin K epoxide reductase family protein [Polyangiaceae bacterium]